MAVLGLSARSGVWAEKKPGFSEKPGFLSDLVRDPPRVPLDDLHARGMIPAFYGTAEFASAMRHVLSAIVQNVPGGCNISGMLASRGLHIDSLAVGETEDPNLSRMTFVMVGDDHVLEQVRKQLEKIVTVVRVEDISSRDLMLNAT